jgi:UDP-N-acetylglucosamine 3-dehydrogenase
VRRATPRRHRVTVVGLGVMGRRHARVFAALSERFELVGAYDLRAGLEWPEGLPVLGGEREAIARADVVVVATPTRTHAGIVARALAAGRHVLVEKPLCARAAEAEALGVAASRGSARLFVGHSERFNPVVRALARLVRGERVVAIDTQRVGPSRPSECGVLVNLAVHDLDLAAYLGGGQAFVHGAVSGSPSEGAGEDVAHVLVTTTSGAFGHLYVDRTALERRRGMVLTTSRWIYEGDLLAHRLVRAARDPRESGARAEMPLLLEEPLVGQAIALADALDGGTPRELATALDGTRALALAERAASHCASAANPGLSSAEKLALFAPP